MKAHSVRSPLIFFGLVFLISWSIWVSLALTGGSDQILLWVAGFGPTLAALLLILRCDGWAGVGNLLKGLLKWRVNPIWYFISLLGTPVIILLALGLHVGFGGAKPQYLDPHHLVTSLSQWPVVIIVFVYILVFTALGEELGWRGFALPLLQSRYSPLISSLILGSIWQSGIYHCSGCRAVFIANCR